MKKTLILGLLLAFCCGTTFAQSDEQLRKERLEMMKASASELSAKSSKEAKKEAKKLTKEGWKPRPGALPLEKQLDRSYKMQYQYDEETGYPKYIFGTASSRGESYDAARSTAEALAKENLAGQIQTEVSSLISASVANKQLSEGDAASVVETVSASKSLISQNIGRIITVMEVSRVLKNKNEEVLVRIAYNGEQAKEMAKKIIRAELEDKGDQLHGKIDEVLK